VHVSSDVVFSGSAPRYGEAAPPDPVTPYGAAKAAAETAVNLLKQQCSAMLLQPEQRSKRREVSAFFK
jgi:dTDP-4-dehydrorhamnose reductase